MALWARWPMNDDAQGVIADTVGRFPMLVTSNTATFPKRVVGSPGYAGLGGAARLFDTSYATIEGGLTVVSGYKAECTTTNYAAYAALVESGDLTIAFWYKSPASFNLTGNSTILSMGGVTAGGGSVGRIMTGLGVRHNIASNQFQLRWSRFNGSSNVVASFQWAYVIPANTWMHVVLRRVTAGTNLTGDLFINGVKQTTATSLLVSGLPNPTTYPPTDLRFTLGAGPTEVSSVERRLSPMNGTIADLRIYDIGLSQAEVTQVATGSLAAVGTMPVGEGPVGGVFNVTDNASPQLQGVSPAAASTGTSPTSTVRFDVVDYEGNLTLSGVKAQVQGLTVFDNGQPGLFFQGWTGTVTTIPFGIRVVMTAPSSLGDATNVVVRVTAADASDNRLDQSWTYKTAETTKVTGVSLVGNRCIKITFSTGVRVNGDLFRPSSYGISTRLGYANESYAKTVTADSQVEGTVVSSVTVCMRDYLSLHGRYSVRVQGPLDEFGRVIDTGLANLNA